jgi:hypothetical protein
MAVTKKGLIEAAEKCFKRATDDMWWGYPNVTEMDQYLFCNGQSGSCENSLENGEYSVWFLLLCAEMAGED